MPDALHSQLPLIKEFVRVIGVSLLEEPGFEADDVIGTLTHLAKHQIPTIHSYILTGDKDVLQLIDSQTFLILPRRGVADVEVITHENIKNTFELDPSQVIDFKALKGDPSDNIPGVLGVGDKTALKLLAEFGTLNNLYDHLDQVSSASLRQKLIQDRKNAFLSQQLATIYCAVPLSISFAPLSLRSSDAGRFLEQYELTSLLKRLHALPSQETITPSTDEREITIHLVKDSVALKTLFAHLPTTSVVACFLALENDQLLGIALSWEIGTAYYLVLQSPSPLGPMFDVPAETSISLTLLKPLFSHSSIHWVCHQAKDLFSFCYRSNFLLSTTPEDTMLMAYLLNPDRTSHSIEKCLADYFGRNLPTQKSFLSIEGVASLSKLSPERAGFFCGQRAEGLLPLYAHLSTQLLEENLFNIYTSIDLPLIPILSDMEHRGIQVDCHHLRELSKEFHRRLEILQSHIYSLAGYEFNLNSPKQLSSILFEKMGLPVVKKIQSGASTNIDVLEALSTDYPIAKLLIDYRQLSKLLNTYIDVLPRLVDSASRIHTSLNITVAATGRLSSSDPNLQNIPIRTEDGEKIRKAFVAKPGHLLVLADYSQIELRILAHISRDERLVTAFLNDEDIHSATAATIFSIPYQDVTPTMRRKAKEINFGIAYGMQAFGLAQRLGISQKEAANYLHLYFERYPQVKIYIDQTIDLARRQGYVATLFGRKRYFRNYNDLGKKEQATLDRMIINAPIQGTAADIIKLAMLAVHKRLDSLQAKLILQIHDELIVETPVKEVDTIKQLLKETMETVTTLSVPLTINLSVGSNWLEAK